MRGLRRIGRWTVLRKRVIRSDVSFKNKRKAAESSESPTKVLDSDEEEQMSVKSIKGKKKKRKRIIADRDDESDICEIESEGTALETETGLSSRRDSANSRRSGTPVDDEEEAKLREEAKNLKSEELESLEASALFGLGFRLLNGLETLRKKSPRIQGMINSRMKCYNALAKDVFEIMTARVQEKGDTAYLRIKNMDLMVRLKSAKRKEEELQEKIDAMTKEIKKLRMKEAKLMEESEQEEEVRKEEKEVLAAKKDIGKSNKKYQR